MSMVSPKKRRQPPKRNPVEMPIPDAGNERPEDAAAEAELESHGVRVDPIAPAGMTPEKAFYDQMEQLVFSDTTLARNPQARRLILEMSTERVTNPDGSLVMVGPEGSKKPLPGTWRQELWRHGFRKALQGDEEWAKRLWNTTYGLPRAPVEVSGPGGGPIEMNTRTDDLSPEEMAQRFVRAAKIAQEIMEKSQAGPLAIEGIEVSSKPVATPAERGQAVIDVIAAPTAQPSGTAPPATQAPQVGSIIRR